MTNNSTSGGVGVIRTFVLKYFSTIKYNYLKNTHYKWLNDDWK